METHLAVGLISLSVGWISRAVQREAPPSCVCHCGCACESTFGWGIWALFLVILIGLLIIGCLGAYFVFSREPVSSPNQKGRKGVFGAQGKVLTLTS